MKRITAGIIDLVISVIILGILLKIFIYTENNFYLVKTHQIELNEMVFKIIIVIYISFFYILIRDIFTQFSLGKMIFKLKVIDKISGQKASIKQRIIRNIILYIFSFLYLFFVIEFLMIIFNKGYRIGDLIGKTKVIEKQKN